MRVLDIRHVIEQLGDVKAIIGVEGIDVGIEEQKTGYGVKKFLECPRCYQRREKLYVYNVNDIYCRSCSPISPYKAIQNSTKGGEPELEYRMHRVAKEYGFKDWEFPFNYMEVLLDRPKYYRHKKWEEGIRKMQALENMRFQNILYKNRYRSKEINHVFNNRLYSYNLRHMRDKFIDWYI